jgi:hypothetical protein
MELMLAGCLVCGTVLDSPRKFYCGPPCSMRAYRRRKAGVPVDAYPRGRRGRVPLGAATSRDRAAALLIERPR